MITDRDKIEEWLSVMNIDDYTISDGVVSVNHSVNLHNKKLTSIPFKFGTVDGFFDCSNNQLTSFESFPHEIAGFLSFEDNEFESIVGLSNKVKFINDHIFIGGNSIKYGGLELLTIKGLMAFPIGRNKPFSKIAHEAFTIIEKYIEMDNHRDLIFECQQELIDSGFEDYAQI